MELRYVVVHAVSHEKNTPDINLPLVVKSTLLQGVFLGFCFFLVLGFFGGLRSFWVGFLVFWGVVSKTVQELA